MHKEISIGKLIIASLIIPAVVIILHSVSGFSENLTYPIRWTPELKIKNLDEIEQLLDEPVDMSKSGGELTLTNKKGQQAKPMNCNEYFTIIENGFIAQTTYDLAMESWFKAKCMPLQYIKNASSSQSSYVSDFNLGDDPLQVLPPTLGFIVSNDEVEEAKTMTDKGMKLKDFAPEMKVEIINQNHISLKDSGTIGDIVLLAWGDFNKDGIEDILLKTFYHSSGSYFDINYVILTKQLKQGNFIDVSAEIINENKNSDSP